MAKVSQIAIGSGTSQVEVQPGCYRKESIPGEDGRVRHRVGETYLTVDSSAALHYTNSNGEKGIEHNGPGVLAVVERRLQ
jgi:hypothetical protein